MRRIIILGFVALSALVSGPLYQLPAGAATGDVGYRDGSSSGTGSSSATGEKPESKVWFTQDNVWWSWQWNGSRYDIARLDSASHAWKFQGLNLAETRGSSRGDTLYDPSSNKLYVSSHQFASSSSASASGNPSRFFQLTYNPATQKWSLDSGFPATINNNSSETLVVDKDSTGRIWATWTQGSSVYVNWTTTNTHTWAAPTVLPTASASHLESDDISSLVEYGGGSRIGVMWSNQTPGSQGTAVYFSTIAAGAANPSSSSSWTTTAANGPGAGIADDHLDLKALESDGSGRVFAVVKTSFNDTGNHPGTDPQIELLVRSQSGTWSRYVAGQLKDCQTRPVLVLDPAHNLIRLYLTAPEGTCQFSGQAGTIYEKTSSLSSPSFGSGKGTPIMRNAASQNLNNVSATKQEITSDSGVVLLASNDVTHNYWHSEEGLGSVTPPPPPPPPPPASGSITVVAKSSLVSPATSSATVTAPSGTAAGDVLVASLTIDNAPTVSAPSGWTRLSNMPLAFTGATVDAYYHVVTASEAGSYTWTFNSAQKFGAGITAYRGVDQTAPFDTAVSVAKSNPVTSSLTIGGVTASGSNDLLIGGVGLDARNCTLNASGFTASFMTSGDGQVTEQAYKALTASGSTGNVTFNISPSLSAGGWITALKPAAATATMRG